VMHLKLGSPQSPFRRPLEALFVTWHS